MSPPAVESATDRQDAQTAGGASARPPRRIWLYVVFGLGALWALVLVGLTVFTANPVTLNRAQLASADRIVTARLEGEDRLRIEKNWTGGPELPVLLPVRNLDQTAMRPGQSYIVPLRRGVDWWEVAPSPLPTDDPKVYKPLVYPATPEAIAQLEAILAGDRNAIRSALSR